MKFKNFPQTRVLFRRTKITCLAILVSACAARSSSELVFSERVQTQNEKAIEILLDSGDSKRYKSRDSDNPEEVRLYNLSWIDEESGFAFVHVTEWESERGILVELGQGKEYQVGPQLEFSPDGRWFFDFWEDWSAGEADQRAKLWSCPERDRCRAVANFIGYAGVAVGWPDQSEETERSMISIELSKLLSLGGGTQYATYESECSCTPENCRCSSPKLLEKEAYAP